MLSSVLIIVAAIVGVVVAAILYIYGRFGRRPHGLPSTALPVAEAGTELDRLIMPLLAGRPNANGVALVSDSIEALVVRAHAARRAGRSLDLQYYYWKDDLTGLLLAREILAAADRGVCVRLLLDDINAGIHDRMCIALDAHPNIEVRLFNPSRARTDRFRRGFEMAIRAFSATRRMHNKLWVADGRVAIAGGRNIGDAYFDAAELSNFRDLDVWMVGPVLDQASAMFDRYWNSDSVLPIAALRTPRKQYLPALREAVDGLARTPAGRFYIERVDKAAQETDVYHGTRRLHWSSQIRLASDPPEKALMQRRQNWLLRELFPLIEAATRDLRIISPYFIPGVAGTRELAAIVSRGARVAVLTNSLAATDVAAVHGGYIKYRRKLIQAGIALFELKEQGDVAEGHRMTLFGRRNASLHSKAFVVDGLNGFVGSMNFDPRSASLNTEMGVVFADAALAGELASMFEEETSPSISYRLGMDGSRLVWRDRANGSERLLRREPDASLARRMIANLIRILPIESQL